MANRLLHIADEVEEVENGSPEDIPVALTLERYMPALATLAESMYQGRRRRDEMFDSHLFGEPAWDMLLDLYVNHVRGRRISVTSLCHASARPITTALRWIAELEERGLVLRDGSASDNRVRYVGLTRIGVELMNRYFWTRLTSLTPLLPLRLLTI